MAQRCCRVVRAPCGELVVAARSVSAVLVLLPPSESKAAGGDGAPLDLATLSWPQLIDGRADLVQALVCLAADPPAARAALGLSSGQDSELERNAGLLSAPTAPAL